MANENETPEVGYLQKGKPCPDYPNVMQMSVACENCRFNHWIDSSRKKQTCRPHSHEEARRKGEPHAVPDTFCDDRLRRIAEKQAEETIKAKEA